LRALPSVERSAPALIAALALLAGCEGDGDGRRDAGSPARSTAVARFPCHGGFVPERGFLGKDWRRRSVRIGPLTILNAPAWAQAGFSSRRGYKLRVLFPPSRSIEIEFADDGRRRVGFLATGTQEWSGSPSDLQRAIRIEHCPRLPPELREPPAGRRYGYGLVVGVRRESCVPLVVTRDGGRSHRGVVSFGAGKCAGQAPASCRPDLRRGVLPAWARGGFASARPRMPHVVGRAGEIAALVFGDPLVSPPRKRRNNKILWVSRRPADDPSDLVIGAQRMVGARDVGPSVRRRVQGGPGPSIVDVPAPGCWRLGLSWSGRTDIVDLRYERRAAAR
jgi:hypothetical protein